MQSSLIRVGDPPNGRRVQEVQGSTQAGGKQYQPLRRSRNGRGDAPQVVSGLAVTRDGFPVRHWVFPGNTVDVETVQQVQRDLDGWRLTRLIFVGDAGMVSEKNLQALAAAGGRLNLAAAIWTKSGGMVNPRHTTGHWLLCQKYKLLEEVGGRLGLTQKGQSFVDHENGEVEASIDEQEGVAKILSLVAANGPTGVRGVLEEWSAYLTRHSAFGSPSTRRDTLRRRLRNLVDRGLVSRKSTLYAATESGLAYLKRLGKEEALGDHKYQDLLAQAQQQSKSVREELRELLLEMDSFAFEHLVKRLLDEMDYQDVEVTKKSGDGGVDVIAEIELGITSVKEVVQAKRHRGTIQRKDLDALRGSLHRFGAVRGTIITTSGFSSGTMAAAFEAGVAPITLVDGNKLIDLLIKHGIGVRKRIIEVLAVDTEALKDLVADD